MRAHASPESVLRARRVAVVLFLPLMAGVACGASITAPLEPNPGITGQYWRDTTGTEYSQDFQGSFSYDDASVEITYDACDDGRFRGSLIATGLKPHFCYQIKLHGKPPAYYGPDGDVTSSEAIGYEGRWWRFEPPPPWNATDAEYEAHRSDPNYVYAGYVVFDFFVTDAEGSASIAAFESENSYHVIWKTSQRSPGANDGPARWYDVGGAPVGLYGEWEPTRDLPGDVYLPVGHYNVAFWLTEESFHDPNARWALAMTNDHVGFDITPEPASAVVMLLGVLVLGYKAARHSRRAYTAARK